MVSTIFVVMQAILIAFYIGETTYSESEYSVKEYIAVCDIMAMLLLGFGYLMTFLQKYGMGASCFHHDVVFLSMEFNIVVEFCIRLFSTVKKVKTLPGLCPIAWRPSLDSEFAAATFMITFDAIIGRASPLQLIIICISQSFFLCVQQGYSCPWIIDRRRRCRRIHDHSHIWRYFGLAVSYALGAPKDAGRRSIDDA